MANISGTLRSAFQKIVGSRYVLDAPEVLKTYESDACVLMQGAPDIVLLPATTEEVAACIKRCNESEIPFIARGSGTGLSGGTIAMRGGVFVGLSRMNRILEIDPENQLAVVETGVINAWLNREVAQYKLFYAPDPSSQAACTVGGNVAENAGGIHCLKYGVTADHILGLEVVTPQGDIVQFGGRHGHYGNVNWVGLFVGSEGTFGVATKAIVKLTPVPEYTKVYLLAFDKLETATDLVAAIIASGLLPSALELIDAFTVKAVNQAFQIGFPETSEAVLLVELDGTVDAVNHQESQLYQLLKIYEPCQKREADGLEERTKLWKARKGAVAAYGRILPAFYLHDCVIPRSQLTPVLRKIQEIGETYNVHIGNVFHAGDGNLHPNILLDPTDAEMVKRVLTAGEEILKCCLAVGGVLSGEHGIGAEKSEFMALQFEPTEIEVMLRLKQVFDPKGIANPDKIFPMHSGCGEVRVGLPFKMLQTGSGWI